MKVIRVATNDPEGPCCAKGVGGRALDPVPVAIANAIYDAVGVQPARLPIPPERLRAAIQSEENGSEAEPI